MNLLGLLRYHWGLLHCLQMRRRQLAKGRRACDNDGTSWRWRPVQGCYVSVRKAITVRVIWNRPSMAGNFQFWFGEMELAQMSVTGFGTS